MISLRLTDAQIVSFNEVFQTLFERSRKGTGNEMNSSVVRMAINIGRILSIVALLRITGECEEAGDFAASLRKSPRSRQTRRPAPTTSRTGSSPAGISPSKRMISKRSFPWPSLCTYTPYTYSRSFPPTR